MGRKRTITNVVEDASAVDDVLQGAPERSSKRTRGRQTTNHNPISSATVPLPAVVATPSPRRSTRAKVTQQSTSVYANAFGSDDSELSEDDRTAASHSATPVEQPTSDSEEEDTTRRKKANLKSKKTPTTKTPKKKVKPDVAAAGGASADASEAEATPSKKAKTPRKRKPKVTEPIVYDIPDVEKRETTFKGRLGYACLNTILRNAKPDPIFCSRTCRIATIKEKGMEFVYELGLQNIRDLLKLIEWNEKNKIRFMRMSSEIFPFASHALYGYDLSFADKELKEAGELAKKYKHRLTMHPGQFTQLGSPKEEVVTASVRELEYQCEIMDRMGLDQDSVMIVHMGGVHGDKEASLARFKETYKTKLPDNVKGRLVLENDELCYNLDDIMPLCEELDIPVVIDYHHDWIYPSERPVTELIPIVNETWKRKGIRVKQHLSEPRPGAVTVMEKRAHADRCKSLPEGLPDDVDLMIEAKDKEQAVFELYRIYGLEEVIWENLRPPKKDQTLATNGKKSAKTRNKKTGVTGPDGKEVVLKDVEKEGEEAVIVAGGSAMGADGEDVEMARGCPSDEE
ncbi:hypothetical protein FRC04_010565 [Tulasnella sp. 424]|nr:hypothetical protein FRC04_010565 [Tulasnella sp. 424]KAG8972304.1 hypothetical protein FRC05_010146 [Tulasnella sp. 425]